MITAYLHLVNLYNNIVSPLSEIYGDNRGRRASRFSMWSTLTPSSTFTPHSSVLTAGTDQTANNVTELMTAKICDMMRSDKESFSAVDNHPGLECELLFLSLFAFNQSALNLRV
jgi:hypothetical protein